MTTDTTALQERIERELEEMFDGGGFNARDMARDLIPLIAAEMRAASERAWGEGVAAWRDYENGLDPRLGHPRRDTPLNPYSATKYETGDRA